MLKKTLYILSIIILIVIVAFLVIANSVAVDLVLLPNIPGLTSGTKLENFNLGLVVIGFFALGFIVAWIFTSWMMFRGLIQRKFVEYDVKKRDTFIKTMLDAREAMAAKDWTKAQGIWEKILSLDPSKVLSNVEISKILEQQGKPNEALKRIDQARMTAPENVEVLFRATDLNIANSNYTAALDNLALILAKHPNQKAALLARNLSEKINRLADALEYNERAVELGNVSDYQEFQSRIEFQKICLDSMPETNEGRSVQIKELNKFLKKYKDYLPAILAIADLEERNQNFLESAELYLKSSKISKNPDHWNKAIQMLIDQGHPDKALLATKAALKNLTGLELAQAQLDLIKVNLALGNVEESESLLNTFSSEQSLSSLTKNLQKEFVFLKGLCLNRLGKNQEATKLWVKLSGTDFKLDQSLISDENKNKTAFTREQPAPKLSTP